MIPGPAKILCCPFCGGKKKVMNLFSGNSVGTTLWSDTRSYKPMLPEVSPIQKCPHCGKYYFLHEVKTEHDKSSNSWSLELGELTYQELKEAYEQMSHLTMDLLQRMILYRQLFMAYNDRFRRGSAEEAHPSEEDEKIFLLTVEELLKCYGDHSKNPLFRAELLREVGRFDQAKAVMLQHESEIQKWVVDAMLRHIEAEDTKPFLLIKDGKKIN